MYQFGHFLKKYKKDNKLSHDIVHSLKIMSRRVCHGVLVTCILPKLKNSAIFFIIYKFTLVKSDLS